MSRHPISAAFLRGIAKPAAATRPKPAAAAPRPKRRTGSRKSTAPSFAHLAGVTLPEPPEPAMSDRAIQRSWDRAFARAGRTPSTATAQSSWDSAFARATRTR